MLNIEILGVGGKRQHELTQLLNTMLKRHDIEAQLKYNNDIDTILKRKVEEVPALFINDKFVNVNSGFDEKNIEKIILETHKIQQLMKKILVPTDLSSVAGNAYRYAVQLAKELGSHIDTLHVYHTMADVHTPLMLIRPYEHTGAYPRAYMKSFVEKATTGLDAELVASVPVDYELEMGFPATGINYRSENYDLIVMGKKGENNLSEKLFGGVATTVAASSKCPVLLVPEVAEYRDIKRILYAYNEESLEAAPIDTVMNLAEKLTAQVHFVHVDEDKNKASKGQEPLFEQVFSGDAQPAVLIEMVTLEDKSMEHAIDRYVKENAIDLVVMYSHRKNIFERLFLQSHTRNLGYQTEIPLLVLHE